MFLSPSDRLAQVHLNLKQVFLLLQGKSNKNSATDVWLWWINASKRLFQWTRESSYLCIHVPYNSHCACRDTLILDGCNCAKIHKKSVDDLIATKLWILNTSTIVYPPAKFHADWTIAYVCFKKAHFWWCHHDVTLFSWIASYGYYLTNTLPQKSPSYHLSFTRYKYKVENGNKSYKIARWRHHHVTAFFVYNTFRNTCVASFNWIWINVLEIWRSKVSTFGMTSRATWWRHSAEKFRGNRALVAICVCQIRSNSVVEKGKKCPLERARVLTYGKKVEEEKKKKEKS